MVKNKITILQCSQAADIVLQQLTYSSIGRLLKIAGLYGKSALEDVYVQSINIFFKHFLSSYP